MRASTTKGTVITGRGAQKNSSFKHSQYGFTIVEVLIVLAVTGILFASTLSLMSGRQNRAEFTQAINNIKSQIDQTINEVSTGNYPNNAQFTCQVLGPGQPTITGAAAGQGSNGGCISLGRVVHFFDDATVGGNPEQFFTYTIAGRQFTAGSQNVTTSILTAKPILVARTDNSSLGFPDITGDTSNLLYGLRTSAAQVPTPKAMYYTDSTGSYPIGSFALVSSLGSYNQGNINSGSGQVNLLPIASSSSLTNPSSTEVEGINSFLASANVDNALNPSDGVTICFTSGSSTQSGKITIGFNNQTLGTTLTIHNTSDCT
jgi:prepilin-type N-terminal cleavage/methylation domain-containing protein